MNRAVYYVSRMISSQKQRDFVGMNYDEIRRVFSIWICKNMKENSMDYVHLVDDKVLGSHSWEGGLDLLNIVLVGIAEKLPDKDRKEYELHRLLSALLSVELSAAAKFKMGGAIEAMDTFCFLRKCYRGYGSDDTFLNAM